MKHTGTIQIETEHLILRQFIAEAAFRNWMSDAQVTKFLRWPTHRDISVTEAVLKNWMESYQNKAFYQWAIVPKDLGEPIGSIRELWMPVCMHYWQRNLMHKY